MLYSQTIIPSFSMRKIESLAVAQLIPPYVGSKPCT